MLRKREFLALINLIRFGLNESLEKTVAVCLLGMCLREWMGLARTIGNCISTEITLGLERR